MRVLLTGASGFIGTNLVEAIRQHGHEVCNLDISSPFRAEHHAYWRKVDILDEAAVDIAMRRFLPTHVVHLAARTDCDERTTVEDGYAVNTVGTEILLSAIKKVGSVQRIVVISTQFVFNRGRELPKDDQDYHPVTVYGQSKVLTEKATRAAQLACTWTIIRPTTVWGPWLFRGYRTICWAMRKGLYLHPGGRDCWRAYGYVGNVVHQILKILDLPHESVDGRVFYVGEPPLRLLDWVNEISQQLTGRDVRVSPRWFMAILGRLGDVVGAIKGTPFVISTGRLSSMTTDYLVPMDKTIEVLGDPPISMRDGIRRTIDWWRSCDAESANAQSNKSARQQNTQVPSESDSTAKLSTRT